MNLFHDCTEQICCAVNIVYCISKLDFSPPTVKWYADVHFASSRFQARAFEKQLLRKSVDLSVDLK